MFSGLTLTVAMGFNVLGYYQAKKYKELSKLFTKIQKLKAFNYNYVESMSEITIKNPISMAANLPPNQIENFKTYLNVKSEDQEDNYTRHQGPIKLQVHSEKNGYIEIINANNKTRIYNITKIDKVQKNDYSKLTLNPIQKFQNMFGLLNLYYFDLSKPGQQYVFIGEVQKKEGVKAETDKQKNNQDPDMPQYQMKVEAIFGENKDYYLRFLDNYIINVRNKQFAFYGIGSSILLFHLFYFKMKNDIKKEKEMASEIKSENKL